MSKSKKPARHQTKTTPATNAPSAAYTIEPFDLFVSASEFRLAARLLARPANSGKVHYYFPTAINSVFGLELHIKCLHCIRTGRSIHGHVPRDLFNDLSDSDRKTIEKYFDELVAKDHAFITSQYPRVDMDLAAVLARGDIYSRYRYRFENRGAEALDRRGLGGTSGLEHLREAIRRLILEIHPDWEKRFERLGDAPIIQSLSNEHVAVREMWMRSQSRPK
jgi:hypothetical protein